MYDRNTDADFWPSPNLNKRQKFGGHRWNPSTDKCNWIKLVPAVGARNESGQGLLLLLLEIVMVVLAHLPQPLRSVLRDDDCSSFQLAATFRINNMVILLVTISTTSWCSSLLSSIPCNGPVKTV